MIDKEISDFLNNINEANFHKGTKKIRYYKGTIETKIECLEDVYKAVNFDEELNMFRLISGERQKYHRREYCNFQSYFFNATAFLPLIEALKNNGNVVVEADGVKVFEKRNTGHPDKRLTQKGIINGNLRLDGYVFSEYDLHFTPQGIEMESCSSMEVTREDDIKRAVIRECYDTVVNAGTRYAIVRVSNLIANRILARRYIFGPKQWKNEQIRLDNYVALTPDSDMSYARIKELICGEDVNKKIFALGFIFPIVVGLLNKAQIDELSDIISAQLTDNRLCKVGAEFRDTTTVASAAKDALKIIKKYPMYSMTEEIRKQHPELVFGESTVGYGKTTIIEDSPWILEQKSYTTSFPISALEALIEDVFTNPGRQITVTTKGHYHYIHDRSDDFAGYCGVIGEEDKDINIKLVLEISKGTPNFSYKVISEIPKKQ